MKERYQGSNKERLVEALADQELVRQDMAIARELAHEVDLQDLQEGKQLYLRGEPGNNVLYFILSGSVDLSIQDQHVTTQKAGECIGEFPILHSGLKYTVTAVARELSVVASLPESKFRSIADRHPQIWKNTARMLATRLARPREPVLGPSGALRPGELTIGQLLRALTVSQFWTVMAACCTVLAAVAGGAYTLGSAAR